MIEGRQSEDFQPITWVGRVPVYITTLLVALYVAAFVGVALAMGTGAAGLLNYADFSAGALIHQFEVWRLFTYPFLNPPSQGIWFAIEMYLLFVFGREVEKFLGRRAFGLLYGALVLAPAMLMTILWFFGITNPYAGSGAINFAVFVAFAVIYPNAEIFFSLKAKWIALALLALYTVQFFAYASYIAMGVLWLECATVVAALKFSGVTNASVASWLPEPTETRAERRERRRAEKEAREEEERPDLHESIDPLLEKISQHGIGSLTKRERARLEQARAALIERENGTR